MISSLIIYFKPKRNKNGGRKHNQGKDTANQFCFVEPACELPPSFFTIESSCTYKCAHMQYMNISTRSLHTHDSYYFHYCYVYVIIIIIYIYIYI